MVARDSFSLLWLLCSLCSCAARPFESHYQEHLGRALAPAATLPSRFPPSQQGTLSRLPASCELAVVGAGWAGTYLAWRLAVDSSTLNASSICVFEANGRVGGRVFSVRSLPGLSDLAIDVGAYRFQQRQKLPADLIRYALKLPVACYDYSCAPECEGDVCLVMKDVYGNNRGYATGVEEMLSQLEAAGAGKQVYFGAELTGVLPAVGRSTRLNFANGESVNAHKAVLNLPGSALERLAQSSVIFNDSSERTRRWLGEVKVIALTKVYAWYEDAWWSSKMGLMEGYFNTTDKDSSAPLLGRYHDGPLRCVIGKDSAGASLTECHDALTNCLPVYSGFKMPYANCSGALEVYFGLAPLYYTRLMRSQAEPLAVFTADEGSAASKKLLTDVHAQLMRFHADKLRQKGVDPASILPPKTVVMGNWISDAPYNPGIGYINVPPSTQDQARKLVRAPCPNYDVFVADQDYGYVTGWAVGSLMMAEKILQSEFGLPKPKWLDASWYEENILAHP
ncbi:MAG: hypothetical protein SGPRY_000583 [Prymnesium sp.]